MLKNRFLSVTSLMILGLNAAQAHPGHDHAAASSSVEHFLFYGSIAATIATGLYVKTRISKKSAVKISGEK